MEESKRTLFFNAPGFRNQEVEVAPDIEPMKSKRKPLIDQEDVSLDQNLNELDQGTRARNRAFQERLDEVWSHTSSWEAKLKTEGKEAVETILNMKDQYQKHLDEYLFSMKQEIHAIFNKMDQEILPKENERINEIEKNLDYFIKETVPQTIEKQSGEVSRQLKRAYETFDIEKKKEEKRETKLVNRASKHIQKTAQKFEDEDAFLSSCFHQLQDDIIEYERRSARAHLALNDFCIENTIQLQQVALKESETRQQEDVLVLDTVIETQKLLQQTVLQHFGTKADEIEFELPKMEKLENRMNQIKHKKANKKKKAAANEESK